MRDLSIVFDLDGTLVDTCPDLIVAANVALSGAGYRPIDPAVLRPAMSHGAKRMIERGLASQGVDLLPSEVGRLTTALLDYYKANVIVESKPYPHVPAVLHLLRAEGARLSICTNKMESLSKRLLAGLGLDACFEAICGRDTFPMSKPDPEHLLLTIAASGGDRHRAVMVGDSDVDIATAKAAGVPVIGVSYGYFDDELESAGADIVVDTFLDLPHALRTIAFPAASPRPG